MDQRADKLQKKIDELLISWNTTGVPPRATLHETVDALLSWRKAHQIPGLWEIPPKMLGATMDDGWGHGITLILKYAEVMGMETQFLGVLKTRDQIVTACRLFEPDYLGLTVLQFDTEDALISLRKHLPRHIKIVAGGPVFTIDPEFQERTGVDYVAKNVRNFIQFSLKPHT